jgi:two-component system probable response regulator PhcQ
MTPDKILYVDDEAMALKYFSRLVSPVAPVITATSVAEAMEVLQQRGGEIAVLVSDQRMPGARGNELLRHAREHHPGIVRMLTTAYSELGEAVEAINRGEIYRYITKPWDLESLHADLRNALELSALRSERDSLLRQKMAVQNLQLLGHRAAQLAVACAGFPGADDGRTVQVFLQTARLAGCQSPTVDWTSTDHPDLIEMEAARGIALGHRLAEWQRSFAALAPHDALAALAEALPGQAQFEGDSVRVDDPGALTDLLAGPPGELPSPAQAAWLAWLVRWGAAAQAQPAGNAWWISLQATASPPALPAGWLATEVEGLLEAAARDR